jgi:hypothetical protein
MDKRFMSSKIPYYLHKRCEWGLGYEKEGFIPRLQAGW